MTRISNLPISFALLDGRYVNVSGDSMTGALTITPSLTVPLVIGGTGTTSDLTLQTTSGVGTTGADMHFLVGNNGATEAMTILNNGNVGIGTTTPTAVLHLKAGTATANTAPLKFNSGTLLTTAEAGAIEFLTDAYYGTITTGAARKTFAFLESPIFTTPNIGTATGSASLNVLKAGDTMTGNLDMSNKIISNIGAAGTDFNTSGGLTLAAKLTVTAGGMQVTAGNVGVGVVPIANAGFRVNGAILSGDTTQYSLIFAATCSSEATTEGIGAYMRVTTATATFTMATATALYIDNPTKGVGSTITTARGLFVKAQTKGGTNNYGVYIEAPSGGSTDNIGLYNAGTTTLAGDVALAANNLTMTGTIAATGARVTQSYHTNITSTNAVTVDSSLRSKVPESIVDYAGDALDLLAGVRVVKYQHLKTLDPSGQEKLGLVAETVAEPLALHEIDDPEGGEPYPGVNLMGLLALQTRAVQQLTVRLATLEQRLAANV